MSPPISQGNFKTITYSCTVLYIFFNPISLLLSTPWLDILTSMVGPWSLPQKMEWTIVQGYLKDTKGQGLVPSKTLFLFCFFPLSRGKQIFHYIRFQLIFNLKNGVFISYFVCNLISKWIKEKKNVKYIVMIIIAGHP